MLNNELAMEIACDLAEKATLKEALRQDIINDKEEMYIFDDDLDEIRYTEECQDIFDKYYDEYMDTLNEYVE